MSYKLADLSLQFQVHRQRLISCLSKKKRMNPFQFIRQRWNQLVRRSTNYLFPKYYDRVQPLKENFVGKVEDFDKLAQRINGNVTFQMLIYYNMLFMPIYYFVEFVTMIWKVFKLC
jgi:hypothetical protein